MASEFKILLCRFHREASDVVESAVSVYFSFNSEKEGRPLQFDMRHGCLRRILATERQCVPFTIYIPDDGFTREIELDHTFRKCLLLRSESMIRFQGYM